MSSRTVELVVFKLRSGANVDKFRRAAARSQEALSRMRGYCERELLYAEEHGTWVDRVVWESREDAVAALDTFAAAPQAAEFIAMIDPENMKLMHMTALPLTAA